MDWASLDITLKAYLKEMRERLDHASSIARAALACTETGNVEKGVRSRSMSNTDREHVPYATSLINRIQVLTVSGIRSSPASAVRPPRGCGGDGMCRRNLQEETAMTKSKPAHKVKPTSASENLAESHRSPEGPSNPSLVQIPSRPKSSACCTDLRVRRFPPS